MHHIYSFSPFLVFAAWQYIPSFLNFKLWVFRLRWFILRPWICIWLNHHKSFRKNRSHTAGQRVTQTAPSDLLGAAACWNLLAQENNYRRWSWKKKKSSQGSKKRPWKRKLLSSVWQSGRQPLQTSVQSHKAQHCNLCFHQCRRGDKWEKDLGGVRLVEVHKQDNGSSPHCRIDISRVKWNPWSSFRRRCYTEMNRKFSAVLLECQSALTTDAG